MIDRLSKEERRGRVIDVLNQARAMELFAITQYMNQHYGLDSMDYGELAAKMKLIAIDEMRHSEMFAERVKELGGEPTTSYEGDLKKAQDVRSIYPYDAGLEDDTIDIYSQFLLTCRDNGDAISAKLFETIIEAECSQIEALLSQPPSLKKNTPPCPVLYQNYLKAREAVDNFECNIIIMGSFACIPSISHLMEAERDALKKLEDNGCL